MKIGIIVNNLGPSQLAFDVVKNLNSVSDVYSVCVFYQNLSQCLYPVKFATLNYSKMYSSYFDKNSVLIATNLSAALDLSKANNAAHKIYYAYELEFLDNKNFDKNSKAYTSLPVFTRSLSYQQAIKNYANIDSYITSFNINEILWILNTLKTNT